MKLNNARMFEIVREQLAIDMNCQPEDFMNDGVVFTEAVADERGRAIRRQTPHLEIATMGRGTVVTGERELLEKVKGILANKTRDELFESPVLWGVTQYYIPDARILHRMPCPAGFSFHIKQNAEVSELYRFAGFSNALGYNKNFECPDTMAIYAEKDGEVVGVAGASADCEQMWQVGVDVLPQYRKKGIASYLVSSLASMIRKKGVVPYYGTTPSNVLSQAVAHRSGFMPVWTCSYKHIFDGSSPYDSFIREHFNGIL